MNDKYGCVSKICNDKTYEYILKFKKVIFCTTWPKLCPFFQAFMIKTLTCETSGFQTKHFIWMFYRHYSSKEEVGFRKAKLFTWRHHANFHVDLPTYAFREGQTIRMNNSQSKLIIYVRVIRAIKIWSHSRYAQIYH